MSKLTKKEVKKVVNIEFNHKTHNNSNNWVQYYISDMLDKLRENGYDAPEYKPKTYPHEGSWLDKKISEQEEKARNKNGFERN